jgi:hypothetical protein
MIWSAQNYLVQTDQLGHGKFTKNIVSTNTTVQANKDRNAKCKQILFPLCGIVNSKNESITVERKEGTVPTEERHNMPYDTALNFSIFLFKRSMNSGFVLSLPFT